MDGYMVIINAVLLVFYLYLLVRWQHVKRPYMYLVGVGGLCVVFFGWLLGAASTSLWTTMRILNVLGSLTAFKSAVGACYSAKLPVWDKLFPPKLETPASSADTTPMM